MTEEHANDSVDQFIYDYIDTVPQLEALLMVWRNRPRSWLLDDLASGLYISADETRTTVDPLLHRGFLARNEAGEYSYAPGPHDPLVAAVEETYRRELIRLSRLIHSKPSASVREFARAFIWKKERE
jgi:hypothetical protein